jgi:hypothetical protein
LYIARSEHNQLPTGILVLLDHFFPGLEGHNVAIPIPELNFRMDTAHLGEFDHLLEQSAPPLVVSDLNGVGMLHSGALSY